MGGLLKIIAKLYGKGALSKTIGTRTNVITLPSNEVKVFTKKDLNIEGASDELVQKAYNDIKELFPDIPKMNDQEILTLKGNLQRLDNRINPPTAEVVEFGTKQKVSPEGIETLMKQKGQKAPPGTLMGNLESRVKQLEASGKELETIAKEQGGQTIDDIMGDVMQSQKTMARLQDEGLVRAAVRYKMMDDLQKGVLKVPKNLEEVIRGASNEEDVINVFRKNYGEDALEQVDSLVPDFYKMTSPKEAVKKIETDFPNIQPKKIDFPETVDIDKVPPEEFATGGRVGYSIGGLTRLFNFLKKGKKIKNLAEQEKIFREGPITSEFLENVDKKFLEPFIRTRDKYGPDGYGLYKSFEEMPAGLQAAELIKRVKTKGGGIDYESAEAFIGKKLKGDETIDELINMVVQPQTIKKATGGRVGYSEGTIDPAKVKQIKQMLKMGADLDTITSITGVTSQQVQLVQQQKENKATGGRVGYMGGGSQGLDYLMGIDRSSYAKGGMTLEQLQAKAPPGEFLAYINPEEAGILKAMGGAGKKINGIPSFFASGPGDTGGAGGADGAGGNDEGGGGSGDTGDMGSEAANAAATAAGAASVGVGGIGGFGDPGVAVGRGFMGSLGNFGRNVANMARANPISSMVATAVLGPFGSLALNAARAYGPTGTTSTVSTDESDGDGTSNALVQQAIADPLGLNAQRDMSQVDALYNQYRTNVGFQEGGRVGYAEGSKSKKEKTTLSINPMMDEGFDPSKRGFLKGAAGVGAGIAALGTGALRLAKQGVKKAKDLDIIVSKNIDATDGSYGEMDYASYLYAQLKPYSEKSKKLLNKLSKEGKIKKEDNDFYVDIQDINDPSLDALEEIKKLKYDVNSADYALNPKTNKYEQVVTKIKDLRKSTSDNPFFHNSDYISDFESEAAEAAVDILQPKTGKEFIKERADMIERNLKQRGDFANGGLSYLQGL